MDWRTYWRMLRRRWVILLVVLALDALMSGVLFARSYRKAGYQACTTLYVADISAPGLISAPQTTLQGLGQLLSGETAANFFGDDILDVAQSQHVAAYISGRLSSRHLPSSGSGDIAVSGSRRDRTVDLCVANPSSATALAAARELAVTMTTDRSRFVGRDMAKRTYVAAVSDPSVGRASSSRDLVSYALRLILGLIVAAGLALLWDALDPRVRDRQDVERALGTPVLASV